MITILHGEDQLNSRRELEKIISSFDGEVIRFDKSFDPTDFYQAVNSLLGDSLIVVENYLSSTKKIDLSLENIEIVFWDGKELSKTIINQFKSPRVQEFKVPQLVWKFCDSLKPTNGKYLIKLFRETLKTAEAEFIFAMIIRQFRMMLKPQGLPAWQATKISSQAKIFGEKQLKTIYSELLTIDHELKQGLTPFTLSQKIEMLLLWI